MEMNELKNIMYEKNRSKDYDGKNKESLSIKNKERYLINKQKKLELIKNGNY